MREAEAFRVYTKAKKVLDSCKTIGQFSAARKYICLAEKHVNDKFGTKDVLGEKTNYFWSYEFDKLEWAAFHNIDRLTVEAFKEWRTP